MADENLREENSKQHDTDKKPEVSIIVADALKGIKKLWWTFPVAAAVLCVCLCVYTISGYVPTYTASATFTISVAETSSTDGTSSTYAYYYNSSAAEQLAATFPYILSSSVFLDVVMEDLGVSSINGSISASALSSTNMFTLSVTSTNPQDAYNILISVMDNYPEIAQYILGDTQMNIQIPPNIPTEPDSGIELLEPLLYGLGVGFGVFVLLVVLYALTRKTVRTRDDIKYKLGQRQLGTLGMVHFKKHTGDFDDSVTILNSRIPDVFKESIRVIRIRVMQEAQSAGNVIMVTSTIPNEGKSTVALNLAIDIAKQDKTVALVDGDMRNPTIRQICGITGDNGELGAVLTKKQSNFTLEKDTETGLYILGCAKGISRPQEKAGSKEFKGVIESLRKGMDYVIIDTPPCGALPDAAVISECCDGIIYVIRQDYTNIAGVMNAMESISYPKSKIIGCVLNMAETGVSGYGYSAYGYGYKYGYGYGYGRYGYGRYGYGRYGYGRYGYGYGGYGSYGSSKEQESPEHKGKKRPGTDEKNRGREVTAAKASGDDK